MADSAQNALVHLDIDASTQANRLRFDHCGIHYGLGLLEQRAKGHTAQFKASHNPLPFRAADAGVDGQDDHVDIGKVAALEGLNHTCEVL